MDQLLSPQCNGRMLKPEASQGCWAGGTESSSASPVSSVIKLLSDLASNVLWPSPDEALATQMTVLRPPTSPLPPPALLRASSHRAQPSSPPGQGVVANSSWELGSLSQGNASAVAQATEKLV